MAEKPLCVVFVHAECTGSCIYCLALHLLVLVNALVGRVIPQLYALWDF